MSLTPHYSIMSFVTDGQIGHTPKTVTTTKAPAVLKSIISSPLQLVVLVRKLGPTFGTPAVHNIPCIKYHCVC